MEFTRMGALLAPIGALALASTALTAVGAPAVHASAPSSAFAVIGTIVTPTTPDQLAIDANDDTLYVASYSGSSLMTVAPGTTSGTTAPTLALPGQPGALAVDSNDDTVYVRPNTGSYVWVTKAARSLEDTVALGFGVVLTSLAVDSRDDTVYVTLPAYQFDDSFVAINGRNTDDSRQAAGIGWMTNGLGVDQQLGTVWVSGRDTDSVRFASGQLLQFTSIPGTYDAPVELAVGSPNHKVYVTTVVGSAPALQKADTSGNLATWTDPSATGALRALSVNAAGTRAVVSSDSRSKLWILDTSTMQPESSPLNMTAVWGTAESTSGLIYVGSSSVKGISVVAQLQGTLNASAAQPGDTLTITVSPTPATAAGRPVVVDDSTLPSVSFGGITSAAVPSGVNTFSVTVPSAASGTVEAVASLAGGATLSLGNVTIGGDVPPPPAISATEPTNVVATPGDAAASVSWSAPVSSGSYPVSHYLATSSPGGRTCLVASPALDCEVTGLANGTAYTFTVKALTGAGWSASSEPSNVVVPRAGAERSIVITGTREGKRIVVTGRATEMGMGGMLNPWLRFAGQTSFTQGAATILVTMDGTFEWSRKTGKRVSVYVATPDGSMRSNTVIIAAR